MNKRELSGVALELALKGKLEELLASVPWLQNWTVERNPTPADRGYDILAKVPLGSGNSAELWVECKAEPKPSQFPYVKYVNIERGFKPGNRRTRIWVLAAPHISPNMARICQQHGWSWFDLAGNCYLNVPGTLLVERTGKPPVHSRPRPSANLSTPEAGRVVRVLLAPENAGTRWTHQTLSNECHPSVSVGLINKIARHLRDERYVDYLPLPEEGFRLRDPFGLLTAWREAYRFDKHERHRYFTLLKGEQLKRALANLAARTGGFTAYAAFSAAEFQAPHVRNPKTWLYVSGKHVERFEKVVEAKTVDTGENLFVLIPNDDGVFYAGEAAESGQRRMGCTNPVQTYVDVYHCGERGEEAAEALLQRRLKPVWKRFGYNE